MVRKVRNAIVYFLVSLLVIQLVFPSVGGSEKASASHSYNAVLGMRIVKKPCYAQDNSRPYPFNGATGTNHACLGIKQSDNSEYEVSYCMDYTYGAWSGDKLTSDYIITDEQKKLLNYTLLYGFYKENLDFNAMTQDDINYYFATQSLVWLLREGYFYNDSKRPLIEAFLVDDMFAGSRTYYDDIYNNAKYAMMSPSFATDDVSTCNVHTLKWNNATQKYEITLTNTNKSGKYSANNTLKIADTKALPKGVTVTVTGEKVTITSDKPINEMCTIKFVKDTGKKGQAVFWKNYKSYRQNMATLDLEEEPYKEDCYINIQTEERKSDIKIVTKSNDNVVGGIKYEVTSDKYTGTKTYTTGNDGTVLITGVDPGTYTITEVQTNLENYLKVEPQKITVEANETKTVTFVNTRKEIAVDITKIYDGDSGNALVDGSVYGVYKDGVEIDKITISGGKGVSKYTFFDSNATYTVKELVAGKGSELDKNTHNVDTSAVKTSTKAKNIVELVFSNTAIKSDVVINLTLEKNYTDTADVVPGKDVTFTATLISTGKEYTGKTDENGKVVFKDLPYGEYKVEQNTVADGYIKTDSFTVNVTESKSSVYEYDKINTLIKANVEINKTLEISGYEKATGTTVKYGKDVKFVAYPMVNGKAVTTVAIYSEATDDKGKTVINNLTYGKWQINEVYETVPVGYEAITGQVIEIKENGKMIKLEVEDKLIRGKVTITDILEKTDLDDINGNKYGEGIKFVAKPIINGVVKDEGAININPTDKDGKTTITELEYGDWLIEQDKTTVPEGYIVADSVTIAITKDKTNVEVEVFNPVITGKVHLVIKDAVNHLPIPGATIEIYNAKDECVYTGTTDESGMVSTILNYGKYTYKQVSVPDDYVISDKVESFEITETERTINKEMSNERIKGTVNVIITSTGDDSKRLVGSEVTLYGKDGKEIGVYKADENGEIVMGPLGKGDYYFVETKAPEGYKEDTNKYYFTIDKNGQIITKVIEKEIIAVTDSQANPDVPQDGEFIEIKDESVVSGATPGRQDDEEGKGEYTGNGEVSGNTGNNGSNSNAGKSNEKNVSSGSNKTSNGGNDSVTILDGDTPKTFDNANMIIFIKLLAASVCSMILVTLTEIIRRKRLIKQTIVKK